jgi:hypothetical protein
MSLEHIKNIEKNIENIKEKNSSESLHLSASTLSSSPDGYHQEDTHIIDMIDFINNAESVKLIK